MFWFGYRVVELDGSNPGSKCLSDSFETYDLAKQSKLKSKAKDMEHTNIFKADSKEEAERILKSEPFNRL